MRIKGSALEVYIAGERMPDVTFTEMFYRRALREVKPVVVPLRFEATIELEQTREQHDVFAEMVKRMTYSSRRETSRRMVETLKKRSGYGGRKGRSATRRLLAMALGKRPMHAA